MNHKTVAIVVSLGLLAGYAVAAEQTAKAQHHRDHGG